VAIHLSGLPGKRPLSGTGRAARLPRLALLRVGFTEPTRPDLPRPDPACAVRVVAARPTHRPEPEKLGPASVQVGRLALEV
jgi:hypothetical protein